MKKNAIFQEKDTLLMQSAFQNMMSSLIWDLVANLKKIMYQPLRLCHKNFRSIT